MERRFSRGQWVVLALFALSLGGLMLIISARPAAGQTGGTPTATPTRPTRLPAVLRPNEPQRGLIFDGLAPALDEECLGLYRLPGLPDCTHGPDPAPPGRDVFADTPPLDATPPARAPAIACEGDGVSGKRVQVMYVRAVDHPDRYATYMASIRQWAQDTDNIYYYSAAQTGGSRRIRFVHEADCTLSVLNVVVGATADDTFNNTISALRALGYNRTDRKYLIFMDANVYCGIGTFLSDDQPGAANRSNSGPGYGRIDNSCWGGKTAAHELGHNLGAVQYSAPNSSGGGHCVDEYDVMCYSDEPYYPTMRYDCPNSADDSRLDCNKNDYFHTNPPPGSYLATHWNIANNQFLISNAPTDPDDNRVLIGDLPLTGTISPLGDTDTYYFDVWANQRITLAMTTLSGRLDGYLMLYRPDGPLLTFDDDSGTGTNALIDGVSAPVSGRYRVVAAAYQNISTGTYQIRLLLGMPPDNILRGRVLVPAVRR